MPSVLDKIRDYLSLQTQPSPLRAVPTMTLSQTHPTPTAETAAKMRAAYAAKQPQGTPTVTKPVSTGTDFNQPIISDGFPRGAGSEAVFGQTPPTEEPLPWYSGLTSGAGSFLKGLAHIAHNAAAGDRMSPDQAEALWQKRTEFDNPNSETTAKYRQLFSQAYANAPYFRDEQGNLVQGQSPFSADQINQMTASQLMDADPMMRQRIAMQMPYDTTQFAAESRESIADARNQAMLKAKAMRGTGGAPSSSIAKQFIVPLQKYGIEKEGHISLQRDLDELFSLIGNSNDIPGIGQAFGRIWTDPNALKDPKVQKIRSLLESITAPTRHKLFGASLTGNELRSARDMMGQSGIGTAGVLQNLRRLRQISTQDAEQMQYKYPTEVIDYYNARPAQQAIESGSGTEQVPSALDFLAKMRSR